MDGHDTRTRPANEIWPLLALRYVIVVLGISVWLWEAQRTGALVVSALLFSVVLLLELVVHGVHLLPWRGVWAAVQMTLALGALVISPGVPASLIVAAVLAGAAAASARPIAWLWFGVAATLTVFRVEAPFAVLVALLAVYTLAAATGRFFLWQSEGARRHRLAVEQLEKAQARVAMYTETTRKLAASKERQRLAEELHDTLGHALVGTLLQVQVVKRLMQGDPNEATARLERVEVDLRHTLEKVRHALRRGTEQRGRLPLHLAIESLISDFAAAGGPDVELVLRPDPDTVSDVRPEVADVLYRTVQEALTNAVRHGRATHIRVEAEAVGARLFLRVTDNGEGADGYTPGMGLSGMIGRVQAIGGTLRFETAPGAGFTVEVGVRRR